MNINIVYKKRYDVMNKKYLVKAILKNDYYMEFESSFFVNEKDYGNGTYLYLVHTENSKSKNDYVLDLRYDIIESPQQAILDFICCNWSGENGSVAVKEITILEL